MKTALVTDGKYRSSIAAVRALHRAGYRVVVTQTDSDRALPAEELAALVDADKLAGVYPSVSEALAAFKAAGEPFVAAGTITLAGEVAGLLR